MTRPLARSEGRLGAADVLRLRMASLLLDGGVDTSVHDARARRDRGVHGGVAEVVTWFGAMQAQDLGSVLWSLGARLPELTRADVQAVLEQREVLRTWPMRGTVHLVPSRDARWMLDLMGSRALARSVVRRNQLGLSEPLAERGTQALAEALAGGGRLTRAQCLEAVAAAGVRGEGQFGYHLLGYAAHRGVVCLAPNVGSQQTFVLLDEWAPAQHRPDREEALATIALRYVRSHGPTSLRDFAGWTGLTLTDSRAAVAAAGSGVAAVRVDDVELLVDPVLLERYRASGGDRGDDGGPDDGRVLALPGFDEYLLGFKDRTLMVAAEHLQAIIPGGNGVFQPTFVRSGRAVGTWKRLPSRTRAVVEARPFAPLRRADRARVEEALQPYARFLGLPLETRWP